MMRLLVLAFLFVLFTGCPTESKFPLSAEPQEKLDSALLGHWRRLADKPGADSGESVTIIPAGVDSMYKIRRIGNRQNGDVTKKETIWFDVHVSILKHHRFFNMKMKTVNGETLTDSLQKYYIVQYNIHAGPEGDTLISRIYDGNSANSIAAFRNNVTVYVNKDAGLTKFDSEYSGKYYKRRRKK